MSLVAAGSLALLAIAWGAIPLIVREDVPATHLVAARITLGALVLLGFLAIGRRLRFPALERGRVVALGVMLAVHWLSFFLAIKLTTVAVALAVVYLGPLLAAGLSGPLLGERVGSKARVGLLLAIVGTGLVIRPGAGATLGGVLVALVSAVLLAALMIVGKPAARALGGLALATWELVVAALLLSPWTAQAVRQSSDFWPQFILLGALFTGVAGAVYWSAMRRLPVSVVSVIMYLEPASAVIWAALFLEEAPTPATWLGVGLVVAGGVFAAAEAAEEEAIMAPAAM
jgi:drug/metabolite transporter (DMT)-like permease